MKAIVHDVYGSPEVLSLREIARPAFGDDQVLVRVRAAAEHDRALAAWRWAREANGGPGAWWTSIAMLPVLRRTRASLAAAERDAREDGQAVRGHPEGPTR